MRDEGSRTVSPVWAGLAASISSHTYLMPSLFEISLA